MAGRSGTTERPGRRCPSGARSTETNAELLGLASLGDDGAWSELMERYGRLVWLTARASRLDEASVCDVYQTVWSRLWEHRDRIRNPDGLGSWLVTATRRETWRLLRSFDRLGG